MTVLTLALAALAGVLLLRMNVTFFVLTALQLSLTFAGFAIYAARGEALPSTPATFGLACLVFVAGYGLSAAFLGRRPMQTIEFRPFARVSVTAVVLFAGILGSYHLLVSGIPIFSSGIEKDRFDFTSSGLFGLPGRMYILGTTIAWIMASVDAHYRGVRWRDDRTWKIATAFVLAHAILSGFKGELLSTVLLFVGMYVAITGVRLSLGALARKAWWAVLAGAAYFYVIATLYTTYSTVDKPLYIQLLDRATTGGAQSGVYVLERRPYFALDNSIENDFRFLLLKYTGQGTGDLYTFDRLISTQINGTTPTSSAFAPPVTMGGFPEVAYDWGIFFGLIVMIGVGVAFACLDRRVSSSALVRSAQLIAVLALYTWTLKGSLAYVVLNHVAVLAILLVVGAIAALSRPAGVKPTPIRSGGFGK